MVIPSNNVIFLEVVNTAVIVSSSSSSSVKIGSCDRWRHLLEKNSLLKYEEEAHELCTVPLVSCLFITAEMLWGHLLFRLEK